MIDGVLHCPGLKAEIKKDECYEQYLDTHALDRRALMCWGCELGARNRFATYYGRNPNAEELEEVLRGSGARGKRRGRPRKRNPVEMTPPLPPPASVRPTTRLRKRKETKETE